MGIPENIANRKAAEAFVAAWLDVGRSDFAKLTPDAKRIAGWILHDRFARKLDLQCAERPLPNGIEEPRLKAENTPEVAEALKQCDRICEMCEEVPERGEEFAMSVSDGVAEVAETIEAQQRVTADQQRALDNWESGVSRWLR